MTKLYFRELRQWIEMKDHIAQGIEGDRARVRKKEQQNGRCFVTRQKMFLCDGLCDDCEFHRQGGRVVDTNHCTECEIPVDRRGRAPKCRRCEHCRFIYETTTLDEPVGEEGEATYGDGIASNEKGPEELIVEKVTAEEYCKEAEALTLDGAELAIRLTLTACGQKPIHDTSTKENTHTADLTEAKAAKTGSTKTLSGKYQIEGTSNTFYVVEEDKLSLVESGTYSFSGDQITIQYGNNSPVTYTIEENKTGFNLTVPEQSILLPLEYMEGTDGLMNGKPFSGIYGVVNDGPGYVFYSDGTIEVVTTHEAEVTKDSISFGGLTYTWKAKDGKILFYDDAATTTDDGKKKPAITMVPVED